MLVSVGERARTAFIAHQQSPAFCHHSNPCYRQIADLLFAQAAGRGMTLVLVTHDPALAARCRRQVAMRSGRIETPPVAMSA